MPKKIACARVEFGLGKCHSSCKTVNQENRLPLTRALFVSETSGREVVFEKQLGGKKISHPGILYDEAVHGGKTKPLRGNNEKYFKSLFFNR